VLVHDPQLGAQPVERDARSLAEVVEQREERLAALEDDPAADVGVAERGDLADLAGARDQAGDDQMDGQLLRGEPGQQEPPGARREPGQQTQEVLDRPVQGGVQTDEADHEGARRPPARPLVLGWEDLAGDAAGQVQVGAQLDVAAVGVHDGRDAVEMGMEEIDDAHRAQQVLVNTWKPILLSRKWYGRKSRNSRPQSSARPR
jgi:hypothetical protein